MELLGVVLVIMSVLIIFRKRKHVPNYVIRRRKTGYIDSTALIRVFKSKELNSDASLTHADKQNFVSKVCRMSILLDILQNFRHIDLFVDRRKEGEYQLFADFLNILENHYYQFYFITKSRGGVVS